MTTEGNRVRTKSVRPKEAGTLDRRRFLSGAALAFGASLGMAAGSEAPKAQGAIESNRGEAFCPIGGNPQELQRFVQEERKDIPKWLVWWRSNLLHVDCDMLMTDASPDALSKIEPENLIAVIAEAGIEAFWGYIQDPTGWVYYPSKVGQQHPRLNGRDLVAELLSACRKHGLKFMGYFDPMEMGVEVTRHPEWRVEFAGDKVPSSPRLWGSLCFNRPGSWEFFLALVRESLTKYEMDAVIIDDFWCRHCGCAYCQKRYRSETGRELPFYFNWPEMVIPSNPDRPEYGFYFVQLRKWVNQWGMDLQTVIKEARRDCALLLEYGPNGGRGRTGFSSDLTRAVDVTMSDSRLLGYQYDHSLHLKNLRAFSPNPPFDCAIAMSENANGETSPMQEGYLRQQCAYVLSHGGSLTYVDDMDWQGRISTSKYQRCKRVNEWARVRFPYLGGVMVADVGLYMSLESNAYPPAWHHWRWVSPRGDAARGTNVSIHHSGNVALVQAMLRERMPFDVVFRHQLKSLNRHKVIYMSNVEVLDEEEASALRSFVHNGGGLVLTQRTGMRDDQFQERKNFLLTEMIGADYLEKPRLGSSFVTVADEDRVDGFFSDVSSSMSYFEVHDAQCHVRPHKGARALGKVAQPRRPFNEDEFTRAGLPPVMQLIDSREVRQASAGYLYYPEILTEYPAVVLNSFGKGRVAYGASTPCYDSIDDIHNLILALVNWAAGGKLEPTVRSEAPSPVEIVTMEQLRKKRTVVHALNWAPSWPAVRAHDVKVVVSAFGRRPKRAFSVETKSDLPLMASGDRLILTFPPIEAWEAIVIEWM